MSDKRTVSTDALETLGTIHEREEKRDAIHLAVMPVEAAANRLQPGEHIGIKNGLASGLYEPHVGIVDPFLAGEVRKGQRFWLVIYPRKINSLRHVWSHPGIPDEMPVPTVDNVSIDVWMARAAISAVADDLGVSFGKMMEGAKDWLGSGNFEGYLIFGEDLSYNWDMPAFWSAYSVLTGETVPEHKRVAFFRCAC